MRAVHFSAIWLGITARVPDSFQTLCVRGKLFPFFAPESPGALETCLLWRGISWNGYYVSPNCRPPGSIHATSSMKGPPWAGTMSGITLLIVTPGLELLFPQTPVPKLDRFWKKHVHDRIQRFKLTWEWVRRTGALPMDGLSATPFIMLLMHSAVQDDTNFICRSIFGVLNWIEIHN